MGRAISLTISLDTSRQHRRIWGTWLADRQALAARPARSPRLWRGYRKQPPQRAQFSTALAPSRTKLLANYAVTGAGRDGGRTLS